MKKQGWVKVLEERIPLCSDTALRLPFDVSVPDLKFTEIGVTQVLKTRTWQLGPIKLLTKRQFVHVVVCISHFKGRSPIVNNYVVSEEKPSLAMEKAYKAHIYAIRKNARHNGWG